MRRVHWSITTSTQCERRTARFAAKQIDTPQTVFRVTEGREPRWPGRIRCRLVASGENAPRHILVDGNPEGQRDLLRDPWTTPRRVPPFHVDDSGHHFLTRSLWTWLWVPA